MKIKIKELARLYCNFYDSESMPLEYHSGKINYIVITCDYDFFTVIRALVKDTTSTVNFIGIKNQMIVRNVKIK